jgi:hypothetical protein
MSQGTVEYHPTDPYHHPLGSCSTTERQLPRIIPALSKGITH